MKPDNDTNRCENTIIERLLHDSNALFMGLFNNTLIGVYVFDNKRFICVNPRLAELFGYTQNEMCGMELLNVVAPDDRHLVLDQVKLRTEGKVSASNYRFQCMHKDGMLFDCEVYSAATECFGKPATIGVMLDVTERNIAQRAVADQLTFTEKLIETIPNPVFYKDEEGRYVGCNPAFEQFIGVERSSIVGRTAYDICPKDLADVYVAADKALFKQPVPLNYETAVAYADGSLHDVVFYKAAFDKADGSLGGMVGVMLDITERKQMEKAIWHEANFDALTGLPNRRSMYDRLREELKRARRSKCKLALLFIDLDHFKEVNDTLGHSGADLLLIQTARRIRSILRESDIVFRQEGDEFVVILTDLTDCKAASQVAQKIIDETSTPFNLNEHQVFISASVGIANYPDDSCEMEPLIICADHAMYAAKEQGRKCFRHFSSSMQTKVVDRLDIINDLQMAVVQDQIEGYFQADGPGLK